MEDLLDYAKVEFARSDEELLDFDQQRLVEWFMLEPPRLLHVWGWFESLSDWREGGFGVGPISHCEIEAWARLMRVTLYPAEVELLRQIDREYRTYRYYKDNPDKVREKASLADQFRAIQQQRRERQTIDGG